MKKNNADLMVPKRAFGNTGAKISKLCLGGGSFENANARALLDEALTCGVDCWEIVSFTGKTYGDYFNKKPGIRDKVFLSGKIYSKDPIVMQEQLDQVLTMNGTSFLDFLAIHPVDDIQTLNDDVRKWVEKVKKEKKIRFFGFCTHKNMDTCLNGAADLGWIDGIQTVYNYRMQGITCMEDALLKCHEKGIGILAVKSMGLGVREHIEPRNLSMNEEKLISILTGHHLTFEQAKLKAIWRNPNLTSICSLMPNSTILQSNVSAAVDNRSLEPEIVQLLADYAANTAKYFCRRCGACETTSEDKIPIFEIMEMLMYSRGYGKSAWAENRFAQIPSEIRCKIENSDYSCAEKICPQKVPIAQLMKEACLEFRKSPM
jgi:uncharacterized protein